MWFPEELYTHEPNARKTWDKFPLLDPRLLFLQKSTTRIALDFGESDYPLRPIHFALFPGMTTKEINERFNRSMQRRVDAVNDLLREHLSDQYDFFALREIHSPFDLNEFIKDAYVNFQNYMRQRAGQRARLEAYANIRAMELGYRVGTIDESPLVLNAVQHVGAVRSRLEALVGFSNQTSSSHEGMHTEWDTTFGVKIYSYDDTPMHTRVKYLEKGESLNPKYSSILMKMYREGEFTEELKDYLGAELIVENDEERDCLVKLLKRETSLIGHLEKFKDTKKKRTGSASSSDYGVQKFILRVPVPVLRGIPQTEGEFYERVPIEIQVLTIKDHITRTTQTEVTHKAYKRRQFLEVFPALFPREIYE